MALKSNAKLIFDSYEVVDAGIYLTFLAPDPGPSQPSYWVILLTDADLTTAITQSDLSTLVRNRLQRKFRAAGIAAKLDSFIGQSITI